MSKMYNRWFKVLILTAGTVIGIVKGNEARQKWVFKFKNRCEEKSNLLNKRKFYVLAVSLLMI